MFRKFDKSLLTAFTAKVAHNTHALRATLSALFLFVTLLLGAAEQASSAPSAEIDNSALPLSKLQEIFDPIGIKIEVTKERSDAIVTATLNEDNLPKIIEAFRVMNFLNPDMTQTDINRHTVSLETYILSMLSIPILIDVYKDDAKTDHVSFHAKIDSSDAYGKSVVQEAFSFDFLRQDYQKVNWRRFSVENLPKVAKKFRYSPWAERKMSQEGF